ncbi:type I DNA topoisomerase [Microbacterium sp. KSW2-21]|uniref:DNA topoisomerase 1 n=1 Tax=Microbacterium algihabitans TaxID=3075992 RepID=A0ABU3RYP4_9MICO|nr:type I DNA topoisomerase [Microbacterium sp. KSW2-21]MDU0327680.1 type I DNA topoisomerase [Microbacterium sp. KSW2-21]
MANGKKLVIVESPTKMKSIQGYLGDDYEVLSSVGHIRDLASKKEIPVDKKAAYGKYSIDVENDFDPFYVVNDRKTKTVAELKRALKTADEVLLATDGDREGEAIAWHLLEVLKPKVPVRRMIFHEITKDAIKEAAEHTRELDVSLVDAQETRRVLDRLYGWDVSPVLWRKVGSGREGTALSAGRVQSAATRMVVERERERMAFVSASYWDVEALASQAGSSFRTRLNRLDGAPIARGGDYDDNGQLKKAVVVLGEEQARSLAEAITAAGRATVAKVEAKPGTRSPRAPFTTSTMQQEAGRKLSMSAKHAMGVAQRLYEKGFITYMRTDSVALSGQAISAARAQAVALYGDKAVPANPRMYKSKSKNAQEAHEAIRPSGETFRTPASLASSLDRDEQKLYDLIWKRTVASQMADAKYETTTVTLTVQAGAQTAEFTASGTVYTFKGFLEAYEEGADEKRNDDDADQSLPAVAVGDELVVSDVEPKGHSTSPKPRYTEASLVKALEEKGIGRPSTFASIIGVILDRGYVTKRGQALVPSWLAFSVVRLLEEHFADLVDYDFTAALEDDLDAIARGEQRRTEWLKSFYFGSDKQVGLRHIVDNLGEIDARELNSTRITDTATLRFGKYGPYLEVTDPTADADAKPRIVNIPEDLAPDELTPQKAQELIDAPVAGDRVLGENPENGKLVVVKDGRFGPYVQEVDAEEPEEVDQATGEVVEQPKKRATKKDAAPKPRTASLFRSMSVDTIELDTALQLLSLPRVVGADPTSGEEITAQNGRFGPYLKKGTDSRSLDDEKQIFDITLEEALAKYAEPKYGARRASSALKEFDADPVSGKPLKLKDGRFGPYVTDGETNATVPRGENAMEITFERAVELIADKRAKGPAPKRATAARKAPAAKTAAAKTTAAKTTAAKTTAAKTTAAKKTTATKTTAAKTTAAKTTAAKTTVAKTTAAKTTAAKTTAATATTTRKAPAKKS